MKADIAKRDRDVLIHLITYCDEVDAALTYFHSDRETFQHNAVFRNAVSMPIQSIGELTKHFSESFVNEHPEMPWRAMRGMRNYFAHHYWDMDTEAIWKTATEDIPVLRQYCQEIMDETLQTE